MKDKFIKQFVPIMAAFIVLPWLVQISDQSPYYMKLIIQALMWVVIGSSWNLLAGYTGQISFGHAIFFGTGAYVAAMLREHAAISAWWGILVAPPVVVIVAFIIGWVCFRLRGPYFALATIAVAEIFRFMAKSNWLSKWTGGMTGLDFLPDWVDKMPYYYVMLAIAAGCLLVIWWVSRSKWGYYFVSIREDQDAAESMGISAFKYKSLSLGISAAFTGLAGVFYVNFEGYIDPEVVFNLNTISIMAILVAIIGGAGTLWGPAVGAFIMVLVQETFRSALFGMGPTWLSQTHAFVFGLLVILVILFMANGVVGDWGKVRRIFGRRPAAAGGK